MTKLALIYVRFSPRPKHAEGESLGLQIERAKRYCIMESLNWHPDRIFRDPDVSAGDLFAERPGGQLLLATAKNIHRPHIVSTAIDRMFRNVADGILTESQMRKGGCTLHFADQGGCTVNCSTPEGEMIFITFLNIAQYGRKNTAFRTSQASLRYQREGKRMSAKIPYGRMIDPNDKTRIVENTEEMRIVDLILRFAADATLHSVCEYLEDAQFTCRGKKWHPEMIRRIIKRYGQEKVKS